MRLAHVRLNEVAEFEPRVIGSLEQIEEGLPLLDHQLRFGASGRPDILAVDSTGSLVVMELKADEAGIASLDQGIRYLEWASDNLGLLARPFPAVKPNRTPRLFLVAPGFSESLLRLVKYVELDIVLIRAICVKDTESGKVGILLEAVEQTSGIEAPPPLRSLDDIADYILDATVRTDFQRVINEIRGLGVDVQPWKGGRDQWIECSFGNQGPVYLQARQRFFNYQSYTEDGEAVHKSIRLYSYEQWEKEAKEDFLIWFERGKTST